MNERNDLEAIAAWAGEYIAAHPKPDFFLGSPDDQQLQRWFIVPRNEVSNCYLHRFLRSDDDRALHDHPWDNRSWVLSGEYLEHCDDGTARYRAKGDIIERSAAQAHRIELVNGPAVTLFFTGPLIREWGFHCPQGWRHWKDFVSEQDGSNSIGRGCT
jgi:hypothetical protein